MIREFLRAKIHGAHVTGTNMDYEGSITLGRELMETCGIAEFEKVDIYNITNGHRFTTYAITGSKGEIIINGAAAHRASKGDRVIIAVYCGVDLAKESAPTPKVIRIKSPDNSI